MRPLVEFLSPEFAQAARRLNWGAFLPVLTDELVDQYEATATAEERTELSSYIEIKETIGRRDGEIVLATSLFWKNVSATAPDLPPPSRHLLENAGSLGLVTRFDPWHHYVLPLLKGAEKLSRTRPDVTVRVYLAQDLDFLIPDLLPYCEVCLMASSSIRHAPGAVWRFLALEPGGKLVTVADADIIDRAAERFLNQTDRLLNAEVGSWRSPSQKEADKNNFFVYRPMMGWGLGTRYALPARRLFAAFLWHLRQGTFPKTLQLPGAGEMRHFGMEWPGYGIDEWFLATAIYPRLARYGFLTLYGPEKAPAMHVLDRALTLSVNRANSFAPLS